MHNRKYRTTILLSSLVILASVAAMAGASYALFGNTNDNVANVQVNVAAINVSTTPLIMQAFTNGTTSVSPSSDGTYHFKNGGTAKLENGKIVFHNASAGDNLTVRVRVSNASPVKIQWKFSVDNTASNTNIVVYDDLTKLHNVTDRLYYAPADAVASGSSTKLSDYYVLIEANGNASGNVSFGVDAVFANSIERKVSSLENWESAITALQGMENQCYTLTDDITLGDSSLTDQNAGKELFFTPAEGKETFVVINGNGHTITLEGDPTGEVGKGEGKTNSSGFGFHPRKSAMDGVNNENNTHTIGKTRIVLRNVKIVNWKTTDNMTNYSDDLALYSGEHAYFDASVLDATNTTFDGGLMMLGNAYFTNCTFQYSDGLGDPSYRYLCFAWGDLTGAANYTFYRSIFEGRMIDTDKKLTGMLYVHGDLDAASHLNLLVANTFTGASNVSTPSNDVVIGQNTVLVTDKTNVFEDNTKIVNGVSCVDVTGSSYNGETWTSANVMKNLETIWGA